MSRKIRVQIADDHDVVIQGLVATLQSEPDIEIASPYLRSGAGLIEALAVARPRVLLLDYRMPGLDMLSALGRIRAALPSLRVIVLTAEHNPVLVRLSAERGAAGFILKDEELSRFLPQAVREVHAGGTWFSRQASGYLVQRAEQGDTLSAYQLVVC